MPLLSALAISLGIIGGLATFLCLGPLASTNIQIWAVFLGGASFYHVGGKEAGLSKTIVHNVFGVLVAWAALVAVTSLPAAVGALGLPAWAGICVGISVVIAVLLANVPLLSVIPAWVYGYATMAACSLLIPGSLGALLAPDLTNPAIISILSLIAGAVFVGYVSEKFAGVLVGKSATATA